MTLVTRIDMEIVRQHQKSLESGVNPREIKMKLAYEIVKMFHSEDDAEKAENFFVNTFSKKEAPEDVQEISMSQGSLVKDSLISSGIVSSNTEWKRLVENNAVSYAGTEEIIKDPYFKAEKDSTLRIGKKRFVKLIIK